MRKHKSGFTLGEVLIALVIIGIIVAMIISTIKIIKTSYASLAYYEFNNIKQMAAEMISGDNLETIERVNINGLTKTIITRNDSVFCNAIAYIANTTGKVNCDSFKDVSGENFNELDIKTPTMTMTNGRRYYISSHAAGSNETTGGYGYRIIAVDLNGPSNPNKIDVGTAGVAPDIIKFMVLDNGEVYPLGAAADNVVMDENSDGDSSRARKAIYLNSRLKGYYYNSFAINRDGSKVPAVVIDENGNIKEGQGFRPATVIPAECKLPNKRLCDFAVIDIKKEDNTGIYSYREAYCASLGQRTSTYTDYCSGVDKNDYCPPSTIVPQEGQKVTFDICTVENVKPLFRYRL